MKNRGENSVQLEIADIYLKMGLREEARAQYRFLLGEYERLGRRDKALEVMAIMAKMVPNKAAIKKKIRGLDLLQNLKDKAVKIFQPGEGRIAEDKLGLKRDDAYFDLEAELAKPDRNYPKKKRISKVKE